MKSLIILGLAGLSVFLVAQMVVSWVIPFMVAQVVFVLVFGLVWFVGIRIVDGWDRVDSE